VQKTEFGLFSCPQCREPVLVNVTLNAVANQSAQLPSRDRVKLDAVALATRTAFSIRRVGTVNRPDHPVVLSAAFAGRARRFWPVVISACGSDLR
jgi:hypothetical protein